jgi:hypothetical protein
VVTSLSAGALIFLGSLIALLGLFAAGNIIIVLVGLGSIFAAGILQVLGASRSYRG